MAKISLTNHAPIIFRIGIYWTNQEDSQNFADAIQKDGFHILEYGTMTLTDPEGNVGNYMVVFKCIGQRGCYETMRDTIVHDSEAKEIIYQGQPFIIPKGVHE